MKNLKRQNYKEFRLLIRKQELNSPSFFEIEGGEKGGDSSLVIRHLSFVACPLSLVV